MIFIYFKIPKHQKITQFGALAGQIQHMAAQKVGFTPRLHSRAELETCKLWPPALGACKKHAHFWPHITPSVIELG